MEKKKLLDKFQDSPLWFHFIVYAVIIFPILLLAFYLIIVKGFGGTITEQMFKAQLAMSGIISLFFGFFGMSADWSGRKNDKYFTKIKEFRHKAREAKTALELHTLKNELTLYWQNNSCSHPHAQSIARDVYIMIETRMEFEFKVPQ